MSRWVMDVRYSARRLLSRPGYVVLAVLTLALGSGGLAAIISVARPLLFEPLPYQRESEIGVLYHQGDWTEQEFLYLRPQFQGFRSMAAYHAMGSTLEIPGRPLRLLEGIHTSAELFHVLGAQPFLGRTFRNGDDVLGSEPAAVISYDLWRDLGSDRSIVGRRFNLGGEMKTVVGVMPPGFWFPSPSVQVWTAAPLDPESRVGNYTLIGRIDPTARMDRMEVPLHALTARLAARFTYPAQWDKTRAPEITPVREFLVGDMKPGLLATLAGMALILLMACVNVSALMLGQVGRRSTELAVRSALGAGRQQILQQLVIEAALIGGLSALAGGLVASVGFRTLVRALPLGELSGAAHLDWSLYTAAIVVAMLAALATALIPAIVVWRGDLRGAMTHVRTGGLSARGTRLEGSLVVAQIALAVLLGAGAGLLIRSVANLHRIEPGVRVERVAVIDAAMPTQLSIDDRHRSVLDLLPTLQALPRVRSVAATEKVPLRGSGDSWGIGIEGKPDLPTSTTYMRLVTQDYFKTLGVPVRKGRDFSSSDRNDTRRVTIINEALAAKYFPNEDPLGRIINTGFEGGELIVGVVGNVAEAELTDAPAPARYMLYGQTPFVPQQVSYVLAADRPEAVDEVLREARATVERRGQNLAVQDAVTMGSVLDKAIGAPGRVAILLSLLAGLALVLGSIGVYGMISQFVSRRTRDYGVRIALGLTPTGVISHVLGRGLKLVALGCAFGIGAAMVLTRLLSSLLYGVPAADLPAFAAAVLALVMVGTVAALVPARRASRTDPVAALRQE